MNEDLFGNSAEGPGLFDERLRIDAIADRVRELKRDGAGTGAVPVEDLILPLLEMLGWEVDDEDAVARAFATPGGEVDFALCRAPGDARILIRVGASDPFDDLSTGAVQVAVSEDGDVWRFHFPKGRGSLHNREFARFRILEDEETTVAETLHAYVDRHAVTSGEALDRAEADYTEGRFPAEARAAWRRVLNGPEVLKRFRCEMEEVIGVAPDPERASGFVRRQLGSLRWPPDPPDPRPARRVGVGDRVWVYDFAKREIVVRRVVGRDPDWEKGEVSAESSVGRGLRGAREGETREVLLPSGERRRARIVLIRGRARER